MKISCQSCQAKYTIADEKVLGKIVKIRCKKCGATIVINGSETEGATQAYDASAQQAAPAGGAGVYDYASGAGDSWTVNVADGDQRTMTTAEIVAAYRSGVVTDETFCWKEGMGDWLPIREISDLTGALSSPSAHEQVAQDHSDQDATAIAHSPAAAAQQPGFSSLFGGGGSVGSANGGSPLFGGGEPAPAPAPAPAAARRAGGRGGGGADLFGSAAAAGGEEDVMTSAAANPQMAPSGGGAKTGERNENSVLFSLNALTQSAPKDEPKTTAQGDGSGLIDIRALGQSMAKDSGPKANKVDDIMNLSGGGAFSAALAAPVLAPPPTDMPEMQGGQPQQSKSNMGLIIGLIGGFAVLGIIVVAALVVLKKPDNIAPVPSATVAANTATTTPTDTATAPTNTAPTASVAANDTAAPPGTGAKPPGVGTSTGGTKPPTGNTGGNTTTVANNTTTTTNNTTTTTTTAPAGGGRCHCAAGDFNCQMAEGAGAPCPGAGGGQTAAPSGGSAPFDRGQAASALGGIASNLSSCKKGDGPTGSGHVKVTFAPNGSVKAVDVDTPPFAGTSVGGCVAGKFRGAKVPAFSGGEVTVGKSFSLN